LANVPNNYAECSKRGATMIRVRTRGDWDKIDQIIEQKGEQIRAGVERSAHQMAQLMQGDATILAPQSHPKPGSHNQGKKSSGHLKQSIEGFTRIEEDKVIAGISTNVDYAPYNEYGTGQRGSQTNKSFGPNDTLGAGSFNMSWPGMVARPFMRPALFNNELQFNEILIMNIREDLGV